MKKHYQQFITPSIALIVGIFLFFFTTVDFCSFMIKCDWWNLVCHAGWVACQGSRVLINMLLMFGAIIIIIISIVLFVRAFLKRY